MTIIRPKIEVLDQNYLEKVFLEAKNILETQGILIENSEAQTLLDESGIPKKGERYYLPHDLVDRLIGDVPQQIKLYDRISISILEAQRFSSKI
jgi:trimethylamine:corrinoid methyltransferase-like protein